MQRPKSSKYLTYEPSPNPRPGNIQVCKANGFRSCDTLIDYAKSDGFRVWDCLASLLPPKYKTWVVLYSK